MTKVTIDPRSPVVHGGLRYAAGETYNVDTETAGAFKALGWATTSASGVTVSEPFICHEATEEDAEQFAAEARLRDERNARAARGEQEPDLDIQDGTLGLSSEF